LAEAVDRLLGEAGFERGGRGDSVGIKVGAFQGRHAQSPISFIVEDLSGFEASGNGGETRRAPVRTPA
jgi:hypothetical protein